MFLFFLRSDFGTGMAGPIPPADELIAPPRLPCVEASALDGSVVSVVSKAPLRCRVFSS